MASNSKIGAVITKNANGTTKKGKSVTGATSIVAKNMANAGMTGVGGSLSPTTGNNQYDIQNAYTSSKKAYDDYEKQHKLSGGGYDGSYSSFKAGQLKEEATAARNAWNSTTKADAQYKKYTDYSNMSDRDLGHVYQKAKANTQYKSLELDELKKGREAFKEQKKQLEESANYVTNVEDLDQLQQRMNYINGVLDAYEKDISKKEAEENDIRLRAQEDLAMVQTVYDEGRLKDRFGNKNRDAARKNAQYVKDNFADPEDADMYGMYVDLLETGAYTDEQLKYDVNKSNKTIEENKVKIAEGDARITEIEDAIRKRIVEENGQITKEEEAEINQIKREQSLLTEENNRLRLEVKAAKDVQTLAPYEKLDDKKDFAKYAEIGNSIENKKVDVWVDGNTQKTTTKGNMAKAVREEGTMASGIDDESYLYMTDDEYNRYCYLLGKEGEATAERYHRALLETLNVRQGQLIANNVGGFGGATAIMAAGTLAGHGSGLQNHVNALLGVDETAPTSAMEYAHGIKGEQIDTGRPLYEGGPSLARAAYDAGSSIVNMLPSIALSSLVGPAGLGAAAWVAEAIGAAEMGIAASGNYYKEALDQGYSKDEARTYGMLAGASEAALQSVLGGISKLGGAVTNNAVRIFVENMDAGIYRAAAELGIKNFGEGTEEYLQDVLTPVFYNIASGEKNTVKLFSTDAAYSFLLATVTTSFMEAGGVVHSNIAAKKVGGSYSEFFKLNRSILEDVAKAKSDASGLAKDMLSGRAKINDANSYEIVKDLTERGEGSKLTSYLNDTLIHASDEQFKVLAANLNAIANDTDAITIGDTTKWLLENNSDKSVDWAERQLSLVQCIAAGIDLDVGDIEELDIDNKTVQVVFAALTGVAIPDGVQKSTAVAFVNNTIKNIQEQKKQKTDSIEKAASVFEQKMNNANNALKFGVDKIRQNGQRWGLETTEKVLALEKDAEAVKAEITKEEAVANAKQPVSEQPVTEQPKVEQPKVEQPKAEKPKKKNPVGRKSKKDKAEQEATAETETTAETTPQEDLADFKSRVNKIKNAVGRKKAEQKKTETQEKAKEPTTTAEKFAASPLGSLTRDVTEQEKAGAKGSAKETADVIVKPEGYTEDLGDLNDSYTTNKGKTLTRREYLNREIKKGRDIKEANKEFDRLRNRSTMSTKEKIADTVAETAEKVKESADKVAKGETTKEKQKAASTPKKTTEESKGVPGESKTTLKASDPYTDFPSWYNESMGDLNDIYVTSGKKRSNSKMITRRKMIEKRMRVHGETAEEANAYFQKLWDTQHGIKNDTPINRAPVYGTTREEKAADAEIEKMEENADIDAYLEKLEAEGEIGNLDDSYITNKGKIRTRYQDLVLAIERGDDVFEADEAFDIFRDKKIVDSKKAVDEKTAEKTEKPKTAEEKKADKQKAASKGKNEKKGKTETQKAKTEEKVKTETASTNDEIPEGYTPDMGDLDDVYTYPSGFQITRRQWLLNGIKSGKVTIEESNAQFNAKLDGTYNEKYGKKSAATGKKSKAKKAAEKVSKAAKKVADKVTKNSNTELTEEEIFANFTADMGNLDDVGTLRGREYTRQEWIVYGVNKKGLTVEEANEKFNQLLAGTYVPERRAAAIKRKAAETVSKTAEKVANKAKGKKNPVKNKNAKTETAKEVSKELPDWYKPEMGDIDRTIVYKGKEVSLRQWVEDGGRRWHKTPEEAYQMFVNFEEANLMQQPSETLLNNKEADKIVAESEKANEVNTPAGIVETLRQPYRAEKKLQVISTLSDSDLEQLKNYYFSDKNIGNKKFDRHRKLIADELKARANGVDRLNELGEKYSTRVRELANIKSTKKLIAEINKLSDEELNDISELVSKIYSETMAARSADSITSQEIDEFTDDTYPNIQKLREVIETTQADRLLQNEIFGEENIDGRESGSLDNESDQREVNNIDRKSVGELRSEQSGKVKTDESNARSTSRDIQRDLQDHELKPYEVNNNPELSKITHTAKALGVKKVHFFSGTFAGERGVGYLTKGEIWVKTDFKGVPATKIFWHEYTHLAFRSKNPKMQYDAAAEMVIKAFDDTFRFGSNGEYASQRGTVVDKTDNVSKIFDYVKDVYANLYPDKCIGKAESWFHPEELDEELRQESYRDARRLAEFAADLLSGDIQKELRDVFKRTGIVRTMRKNFLDSEYGTALKEAATDAGVMDLSNSIGDMKTLFKNAEREPAPVFYSKMERVVEQQMPNKMGADQVEKYLLGKGVKAEEIKWSGINVFLDGKKSVTKDEVLEYLKANEFNFEYDYDYSGAWRAHTNAGEFDNYRSILFYAPSSIVKEYSNSAMKSHWGDGQSNIFAHARIDDRVLNGKKTLFIEEIQSDWHNAGAKHGFENPGKIQEIQKERSYIEQEIKAATERKKNNIAKYSFQDVKEAINEFDKHGDEYLEFSYDITGKYLREEISLDELTTKRNAAKKRHDELREKYTEIISEYKRWEQEKDEAIRLIDTLTRKLQELETRSIKTPDMPFAGKADTYHEFVMKYLTRIAAEEGYDAIGWTTAAAQSERWTDSYAEGYRIEYDQNIPKYMNKFGKQWGVKSELSDATTSDLATLLKTPELVELLKEVERLWYEVNELHNNGDDSYHEKESELYRAEERFKELTGYDINDSEIDSALDEVAVSRYWSMDITPEMRESVIYEGQPLFKNAEREPAPVFYSALEKEVQNFKQDKVGVGTVKGWLHNLIKRGKITSEEVKWSGIMAFLGNSIKPKSVTKQEMLQFLRDNPTNYKVETLTGERTRFGEKSKFPTLTTGKHYDYQEIIFSFPESEYRSLSAKTHWEDSCLGYPVKNRNGIFAHARFDTRILDGKKALYVEEVQSDWHNDGIKRGKFVDTDEMSGKLNAMSDKIDKLNEIVNSNLKSLLNSGMLSKRSIETLGAYGAAIEHDVWGTEVDAPIPEVGLGNALSIFDQELRIFRNAASLAKKIDKEIRKFNMPFYIDIYKEDINLLATELLDVSATDEAIAYRKYSKEVQKLQTDLYKARRHVETPDAPFAGKANSYTNFVMKYLTRYAAENEFDSVFWTPSEEHVRRWGEESKKAYQIEYDQDIPKFMSRFGEQWGAEVQRSIRNQEFIKLHREDEPYINKAVQDVEWALEEFESYSDKSDIAMYYETLEFLEKAKEDFKNTIGFTWEEWNDKRFQDKLNELTPLVHQEKNMEILRRMNDTALAMNNLNDDKSGEEFKRLGEEFDRLEKEFKDNVGYDYDSLEVYYARQAEMKGGVQIKLDAWSMDITPEMRESVIYEGQPLFKKVDVDTAKEKTGVDITQSLSPEQNELYEAIKSNDPASIQRIINSWVNSYENTKGPKDYQPIPNVTEKQYAVLKKKQEANVEKYGRMPEGKKGFRDVVTAKRTDDGYNRRTIQSFMKSEAISEEQMRNLELLRQSEERSTYQRISNKEARAYADDVIARKGFERSVREWDGLIGSGLRVGAKEIAVGEALAIIADAQGNRALANKIIGDLAVVGTDAGQTIQALSMIAKMTPAGKVHYIERAVESINRDLKPKDKISIDEDLRAAVLEATTPKEIQDALDELTADLARQIPVTFKDKWNSWRYFSMLGNPRTHIRNFFGNAVFAPLVVAKNAMAWGMEQFIPKDKRTKSFNIAGYKDFATSVFEEYKDTITGDPKYSPGSRGDIFSKRKIWKTKTMNKMTEGVSNALEFEDAIFLKRYFRTALAGFLSARGVSPEQATTLRETPKGTKLFNEAVQYAILEAQKATYRDASVVAQWLNRSRKIPVVGTLLDGIVPFAKTPINILRRGIEYSPAGIFKSFYTLGKGLIDGNLNPAEFVDQLSSGLTGTGVAVLGYFLAQMGLLRGGDEDDDKEADFKKTQGYQNFSINIGGNHSFTIDWMAPASLPLFTGVALSDLISRDKGDLSTEDSLKYLYEGMVLLAEPMMQLSMLDGLNKTLSSLAYKDDTEMVSTVAVQMFTSYAGQAIPTILGQVARTLDGTRRSAYTDKNSWIPTDVQYFIQSNVQNKIPGWEEEKMAYVDAWGRKDTESSILTRVIENFISPGYLNTIRTTQVDEELEKLYQRTGENSVLPKKGNKYFTVDEARKDLSSKEYEKLLTVTGQTAFNTVLSIINSKEYKRASDEDKVQMIEDAYNYSSVIGRQAVDSRYTGGAQQQSFMKKVDSYGAVNYITNRETIDELVSGKADNRYAYMATSDDMTPAQEAQLVINAFDGSQSINKNKLETEQKDYQKSWFASNYTDLYLQVVGSSRYKNADDETKQDMLKSLYEYVFEMSKVETSNKYGFKYQASRKYTNNFIKYFG